MKVLIAPDKFKGTLSAADAARAIAAGWRRARPNDTVELLPISDGGDGFGEAVSSLLNAIPQRVKTVDAARRPCEAMWWWDATREKAIIESAKVIGLAMLPAGKFHPFELDTFGLGAVLTTAREQGAKDFLIGVGGSATNDGGFGLAQALGWKFVDNHGHSVKRWTELYRLTSIHIPEVRFAGEIVVASDVKNPLLGEHGATRIYGPQKGIRPEDFDLAERCLGQLARIAALELGKDFSQMPGAGAAGGLGFGLMAFLGARAESGFDLFARQSELSRRLESVDLVVTGEGRLDASSVMGKGVGGLAELCGTRKIPCVGLAGGIGKCPEIERLFATSVALTDLTTVTEAKENPAVWLEQAAVKAAENFGTVRLKA
jgi:glycerate 2-kinase